MISYFVIIFNDFILYNILKTMRLVFSRLSSRKLLLNIGTTMQFLRNDGYVHDDKDTLKIIIYR